MSIEFLDDDHDKVCYLHNLLVTHATSKSANSREYETLRHELLSNIMIAQLLPNWLKHHQNLDSFWRFIQPKFPTYAERKTFISDEFALALDFLESGSTNKVPHTAMKTSPTQTIPLPSHVPTLNITLPDKRNVFIVHGRDNETKQEVSRFIEGLGLQAIILHEQVSSGMTIIEKIERYANESDFALVLYTACDLGKGKHEDSERPRFRARQNVVFEHGYLMAKLGRQNVCALVKEGVETPNDINGVVYVPLDSSGAWKIEITRELRACGYKIPSSY
ncbi:MAG: nucleotide-binding protein [Cobetia sp.]|uniref:nucleotide-binding protein n=1 Tax=Cobetia sp. TaxID=1873876 RepID=UPI003241BA41